MPIMRSVHLICGQSWTNLVILPSLKGNGLKPAKLKKNCNFLVQQTLMSEPEEIATMTGQKIPRKCSIGKNFFCDYFFAVPEKHRKD